MTLILAVAVAALALAPNGDAAGGFGMLMFTGKFPTADGDGAYCIPPMPVGRYVIRASHRAQPPSSSPDCASCCNPSFEFEPASHAVVVSKSRATTATRIVLRRVPAYCVRGEVRDSQGALVSGVGIGLKMPSGSAGVFNEGGRFLLAGLPAGNYTVVVGPSGRLQERPPTAMRQIRITNRNVDKLVIILPSPH